MSWIFDQFVCKLERFFFVSYLVNSGKCWQRSLLNRFIETPCDDYMATQKPVDICVLSCYIFAIMLLFDL